MNALAPCPHCSHPIYASTPTCPQCGGPIPAGDSSGWTHTSYDDVPWYRKRWALVLMAFFFMPAALIIAFTGDVYLYKDNKVQKYPKNFKFFLLTIFVLMVIIQLLR